MAEVRVVFTAYIRVLCQQSALCSPSLADNDEGGVVGDEPRRCEPALVLPQVFLLPGIPHGAALPKFIIFSTKIARMAPSWPLAAEGSLAMGPRGGVRQCPA